MQSLKLLSVALALALLDPAFGRVAQRDLHIRAVDSSDAWPAINATGGTWTSAFKRAQSLVAKMTLTEKAMLITGQPGRCAGNTPAIPRLGLPALCLQDGPAGVRPVQGVSQFPAGQAVAATWDRELMYERGRAMGQEFVDQGVHIALSPVTGGPIGRSPLGGRNWEGFAADAFSTGVAAYETVRGLQAAGTIATAKHFIGYEQETFRNPYGLRESYAVFPTNEQKPLSSNIDDKAMHEIYMWGFAEAVRAGTGYIMCSYNDVNGTHACANAHAQNGLLKGELAFQGGIMSDWGGVWGDAPFINGGLDLNMPGVGFGGFLGTFWNSSLIPLVENGTVAESRIDDAAIRFLTPWIASGQPEKPLPNATFNAAAFFYPDLPVSTRDVRKASTMDLIRTIGEDSAVLLKNEANALPLKKPGVIAILGSDAGPNALGALVAGGSNNDYPLYNQNGTLLLGGGSGWAMPPSVSTPYEAINQRGRRAGAQVYAVFNDTAYSAVAVTAAAADVAIVFVGAFATEGRDRANLTLDHAGETLIKTVAANCKNTVVVMHTGGPVLVEDWFDNANVTAVIAAHYPGQEAGDAIAAVLWGDVSPSGKMPYTTGKTLEDYPPNTLVADAVLQPQANFTESTLIDYRWFSAKNITPRFEFGFGLSYSTFAYSSINARSIYIADNTSVQRTAEPVEGSKGLYDVVLQVTAKVKNTGKVTAGEVAQLYVTLPGSEGVHLRGFDKLKAIKPGQTKTATFQLRTKDLALWSVEKQTWYVPEGSIKLQVGASVTKLHLTKTWKK